MWASSSISTRSGTWLIGGLGTMGYAVPARWGEDGAPGTVGLGDRTATAVQMTQPGVAHLRARRHHDQGRGQSNKGNLGMGRQWQARCYTTSATPTRPRYAQATRADFSEAGRGARMRRPRCDPRAPGPDVEAAMAITTRRSSSTSSARTRWCGRPPPNGRTAPAYDEIMFRPRCTTRSSIRDERLRTMNTAVRAGWRTSRACSARVDETVQPAAGFNIPVRRRGGGPSPG